MKFAIVEDSRSQAAVLEALLKSEGHEVDIFADGQSCLNALIETTFDFFIIDWTLPDISGDEVLKRVREHCGWNVPVMFCTARADEESASDILRLGADDFVPKPIRYMEFMARVASLLRRRAPMTPQAALSVGKVGIDLQGRRIKIDGSDVELTQREFDLAVLLFQNLGRVFSRDELFSSIWSRELAYDTRTIDTHLSRLRKKLSLEGEMGVVLTSVYGKGYRLDSIRGN
ncbi:MAG: response regulator transcription factor [Azonexus sp.]|nr:response regulator transcription factor [Azonexus sp.]MBP6202171.1 response regulator transcription factor [Azonexus sp.]